MDIKTLLLQLNQAQASDLLLAGKNYPYLRINNQLVRLSEQLMSSAEVEALITPIIRKEEHGRVQARAGTGHLI